MNFPEATPQKPFLLGYWLAKTNVGRRWSASAAEYRGLDRACLIPLGSPLDDE